MTVISTVVVTVTDLLSLFVSLYLCLSGDIKSLNFLVTKDFTVKLADLGEARDFEVMRSSDTAPMPQ